MSVVSDRPAQTPNDLKKLYQAGEKIAITTCYDASFAEMAVASKLDALMVGDSLGMVIQGKNSTIGVSVKDIVYHVRAVASKADGRLIIADLPFGTYQKSPAQAFSSAVELMEAGAGMVKLEGGHVMAETVAFLTERGIPVCSHIGLTPQSMFTLGGYRVQGKTEPSKAALLSSALALEKAGIGLIVLEAMPASLGYKITSELHTPTIGIGAGAGCSGQVLVLQDMLGIGLGKKPRFVKDFLKQEGDLLKAFSAYVDEVKSGFFPGPEHCYQD